MFSCRYHFFISRRELSISSNDYLMTDRQTMESYIVASIILYRSPWTDGQCACYNKDCGRPRRTAVQRNPLGLSGEWMPMINYLSIPFHVFKSAVQCVLSVNFSSHSFWSFTDMSYGIWFSSVRSTKKTTADRVHILGLSSHFWLKCVNFYVRQLCWST